MFAARLKLWYPKSLMLIFLLLSFVPYHLHGTESFFPQLDWMLLYYWSICAPMLLSNVFVFGIGILRDLLTGTPLGISSLTNIILRGMAMHKGQDLKGSFLLLWIGFAILSAILTFLQWVFFCLLAHHWLSPVTVLLQYGVTACLYPLFHLFCNRVYLTLPRNLLG